LVEEIDMSAGTQTSGYQEERLPFWKKLIYGSGDWSRASFNTLRMVFYAIFLTDVVRLDPRLASIAAFVGIIWDGINDPIVGALSDNVRTRWGRRRPFLLVFAIPFALSFLLLWWAPPWKTQIMLTIHVTLAFMVADTFQTLVTVPYLSLTPEIVPGYDERTRLTTIRYAFNLIAALATAMAAPMIIDSSLKGGMTQQQGYLIVAAIFGGISVIPYFLIFLFIKEKEISPEVQVQQPTLRKTVSSLWQNKPFRYVIGIYVMNWVAFDIVSAIIPYFLLYWIGSGNMLVKANLFGLNLSLESAALGLLLLTATLALPFWNWLATRTSKRLTYIIGMATWIVVELLIFLLQPGQITLMLVFAVFAGISVSTAHVMPDAILPDVIDWDELRSDKRREGMYYGAINLLRKFSSAVATFVLLQMLGWFGYKSPPTGAIQFSQPTSALTAIRIVTGPVVGLLLIAAILFAAFYPLSRERQHRIRRMLQQRRERIAIRRQKRAERKAAASRKN
jgi:GPH family glycoside/pentoside/hexuronide:cation symporter